MGASHFEQMYHSALEVDCAALPTAYMLADANYDQAVPGHRSRDGGGFWSNNPPDVIIQAARGINQLHAVFLGHLQELTARGQIKPRVRVLWGAKVSLNDPELFAADSVPMTPEQFHAAMLEIGPPIS